MKLIEAMKNLKTIEKRIEKNAQQIAQYCAWVSVEAPAFENEDRQRQEVQSLVQANLDLEKEYLRLKVAIQTTNLAVRVAVNGKEYSLYELTVLKGVPSKNRLGAARFRGLTYNALNASQASQRLQQVFSKGIDGANPPRIIAAYKEEDKNQALREWEDFISAIDGRLEVVNAETELQGY